MQNNDPSPIFPTDPVKTPDTSPDLKSDPIPSDTPDTNSSPAQSGNSLFPNVEPETASPVFSSPPPAALKSPSAANKKKSSHSGSSVFLIILGIITLIIVGAVAFLYLTNQNLKNKRAATELSPTSTPKTITIKIQNGDIVADDGSENSPNVIVKKSDYPDTGIIGFAKVTISPDQKLMCFEVYPPAPQPALYIANTDGSNVLKVADWATGCLWSKDSSKLVYVNSLTDNTAVNIHAYEVSSKKSTNLTEGLAPENVNRNYEIVTLGADGQSVNCLYTDTNLSAENTGKQSCNVPIVIR